MVNSTINKNILEVVLFFLLGIAFICFKLIFIPEFFGSTTKRFDNTLFLFLFGVIHLSTSNILALFYNMQFAWLPSFPKIMTPKRVKIFGLLSLIAAIFYGLFNC